MRPSVVDHIAGLIVLGHRQELWRRAVVGETGVPRAEAERANVAHRVVVVRALTPQRFAAVGRGQAIQIVVAETAAVP